MITISVISTSVKKPITANLLLQYLLIKFFAFDSFLLSSTFLTSLNYTGSVDQEFRKQDLLKY